MLHNFTYEIKYRIRSVYYMIIDVKDCVVEKIKNLFNKKSSKPDWQQEEEEKGESDFISKAHRLFLAEKDWDFPKRSKSKKVKKVRVSKSKKNNKNK